jgi:hypothetical protein
MGWKTLDDMDLDGKTVLVRVDINVPLDDAGNVTDATRIERIVPTVSDILAKGGKPVLLAHFGRPKGQVAAERLSGQHGLVIEPTTGRAEQLVDALTHLICAVDTPEARQALQDKYAASAVQASTSGLRLEVLRVDPTAGTACLRCFNPPRSTTSDATIRARVAELDDAAIAARTRRPAESRWPVPTSHWSGCATPAIV